MNAVAMVLNISILFGAILTGLVNADCDCTFTGYQHGSFGGNQWSTSTVGSWVNVGGNVGGNQISSLVIDGPCTLTVADEAGGGNPMETVYESGSYSWPLTGNDNINSVLLECPGGWNPCPRTTDYDLCPSLVFEWELDGECPSGWTCEGDAAVKSWPGSSNHQCLCNLAPCSEGACGQFLYVGDDRTTGSMTSDYFPVPSNAVDMIWQRAGGAENGGVKVEDVGGNAICEVTGGTDTNTVFQESCDLAAYAGQCIRLRAWNEQQSGWGKVFLNNFQFRDSAETVLESTCEVSVDDLFVLGDTSGSWYDAKDWCQQQGYELASIHDDAENSAAARLGRDVDSNVWIGGNRLDDFEEWEWLDGTEWGSYANWDSSYGWTEPNGDGQCMELYPGGTWNDRNCQTEQRPLCRIPTDLFVLGDTLGSWTEAKDWCQKQGYELASIRNDAENSIAAALGRAVDRQMWIGGELNWQWQDGSEWSYTNWHTGEPNAPHNEQCLHFYGGLGTWNDLTCDESQKHRPLCRKEPPTELQFIANGNNVLGNCQGDCDKDSHCAGDLKCWQRAADNIEPIPGCNGDLSALDGKDFCYDPDLFVLGDTSRSWEAAEDWCHEQGYELASIHNDGENSAAAQLGSGYSMWIGGRLVWQWLDGTEWSYENWAEGEPNNPKQEWCLQSYNSGTWNDLHCDHEELPLCRTRPMEAQQATLTTHCDNTGEHSVSNDGGISWTPIGTSGSWRTANSYDLDGISSNTKIRVSVVDEGVIGGFIATVSYDGMTYSTTNPLSAGHWTLVSASDGVTSMVYRGKTSSPWRISTAAIASDANWVWNGKVDNTLVFEFDFGAVLNSGSLGVNAAASSNVYGSDEGAASDDEAGSFDDFILMILGAAIGTAVVASIVALVVVNRNRKRNGAAEKAEAEMTETTANHVIPDVSVSEMPSPVSCQTVEVSQSTTVPETTNEAKEAMEAV